MSRVAQTNLEESVIAALGQLLPEGNVPIAGKVLASKALRAQIQAHVDTMKAATDARARFVQLVLLDHAQRADMKQLLAGIRNHAEALYGELSPEFASFGFKPRKTPQRTVESKQQAAEKLRATRAARHTMGKRQRAAIHGVVP
jgi:hypothetical protein